MKKVGLIGVGSISDWHVRALRVAGLEVAGVAARPGSSRLAEFTKRHSIAQTFPGWRDLLASGDFDALVIASHPDGTPEILLEAMKLKVPILVEKPVAWTSERIGALRRAAHARVLVGYNRRFYKSVQFARAEIEKAGPVMAQLALPESIFYPPREPQVRSYAWRFFENGCHATDMLLHLFGPLKVRHILMRKSPENMTTGFAATLESGRGDVIQFQANWGTPANFSLSIDRAGRRVELKPFEMATIYEGMEVLEPTKECPIRRYVPKVAGSIGLDEIDAKEKPGFVQQARLLARLIEKPATDFGLGATLADAEAAIKLCEDLIGVEYARACERVEANVR